ncbi:MAG: hypothetical protein ACLUE6_00300 [Acutalibacteraceae bacterium]
MTNIYAHISNGDAPKSQHVTEVSFVDENGKHVDIGGGGTTEIHTDATLAGTGTTDNPLKLSDDTNSKIAKAGTLTEDNLAYKNNITLSAVTPVGVYKNSAGYLSLMIVKRQGLAREIVDGGNAALTVPAIPALAAISTLDSSAELTDVINKVNEILNAVKNTD